MVGGSKNFRLRKIIMKNEEEFEDINVKVDLNICCCFFPLGGKLAGAITPSKLTFSPSFGPSQFSIRKVHTCKLHATFELVSNLLKGENWSHLMSTSFCSIQERREGWAKESLVDGCQQIIVSFQSKTHKSDHYSQNYGVALELYASLLLTEVSTIARAGEEDPHLKFMS